MKRFLRWIFTDLFLHKRFTGLFILNLSLGLTGLVTLDSFRHQLETSLELKSKLILGADIGMSSRHPLTTQYLTAAEKVLGDAPKNDMIETYSMVAAGSGASHLVQIKAIENSFPFYGAIQLRNQGPQTPNHPYDLLTDKKAWVYPEILAQLNLQIGDKIKIGRQTFTISDVVEDDAASGFSTSMAPRIYIGLNQLKSTDLVTERSLAWYSRVFKKPLNDDDLARAVTAIRLQPGVDEQVEVYSHKKTSEQMGRLLSYLSDYLGLVSIAAIFLASIGATFLFRSYINTKTKEIAIFRSLGMTHRKSLLIYFWQICFLGTAASLLTFLFSIALTPLLTLLLKNLTSVPIVLSLRPQGMGIASLLGIFGSLFICLPMLVQMRDIKPNILFQANLIRTKENAASYTLYTLALMTLWMLSVWQSNSWIVGSIFIGAFLLCGILMGAFVLFSIRLFDHYSHRLSLVLRMALRNLAHQPKATISCFLALGMGIMLLNIIPQIEAGLQVEMAQPEKSKLPSFFLFDIQDDQVESFKNALKENNIKLGQISPMVQGRLLMVNSKPFETNKADKEQFSREEQQAARFRNRSFNLSYREHLDDSEKIIAGHPFSGRYDSAKQKMAELSVETRFANRLGLKLGDILDFEIQGISIQAKIINLRSVRWISFQPNFFLLFQPGVLEEAPKTYIATIANISTNRKIAIQNILVKEFPNISIVDVTRIVKRISGISQQMSMALQFMAVLCLIVGLLVMWSIASHQALQRRRDINLIKILGAPFSLIRNLFVLEFSILAALAGLMGILLSIAVSYVISSLLFDGLWSWSPIFPIASLGLLILLASTLAYASVLKVLKTRATLYL